MYVLVKNNCEINIQPLISQLFPIVAMKIFNCLHKWQNQGEKITAANPLMKYNTFVIRRMAGEVKLWQLGSWFRWFISPWFWCQTTHNLFMNRMKHENSGILVWDWIKWEIPARSTESLGSRHLGFACLPCLSLCSQAGSLLSTTLGQMVLCPQWSGAGDGGEWVTVVSTSTLAAALCCGHGSDHAPSDTVDTQLSMRAHHTWDHEKGGRRQTI